MSCVILTWADGSQTVFGPFKSHAKATSAVEDMREDRFDPSVKIEVKRLLDYNRD